MKTLQAINFYGTPAALGATLKDDRGKLGITASSISQWGDEPPAPRQREIEKNTRGKLKAEKWCWEIIEKTGEYRIRRPRS